MICSRLNLAIDKFIEALEDPYKMRFPLGATLDIRLTAHGAFFGKATGNKYMLERKDESRDEKSD
jgi:hypothetical protein